jgi:pimeloyl-ACP methyl ester carboxylesterase
MGESVAQLDVGPGGEVRGFKADPKAFAAIVAGTKSYDLSKVTPRALVLLATETTIDMLFKDLDDKARAAAEAWWPKFQAMAAETVANAKNFKAARVVELPKANHYVFLSDRARVLEEIRAFLAH